MEGKVQEICEVAASPCKSANGTEKQQNQEAREASESKDEEIYEAADPCKSANGTTQKQQRQEPEVVLEEAGPCDESADDIETKKKQEVIDSEEVEMFEVGPCESPYQMGFLIGKRFSETIRSRLEKDLVLREQLVPFAETPEAKPLIESLCANNKAKYPEYWDELIGIAEGSEAPVDEVIINNACKLMCRHIEKINEI